MSMSSLSPLLFFETISGYQRSAALKAAIDLEVFTAVGAGKTSREIAGACKTSERGTRILCDYLVVLGFLKKDGERYANTADSAMFLSKESPAYLGGATQFLYSDGLKDAFIDVAGCVRSGGTTLPGDGTVDTEDPVWVDFAKGMMPLMFPAAQELAKLIPGAKDAELKILDVAAGHGIFGIVAAKAFPRARVTALDWAPVLAVAEENAKRFEVSERYTKLPGDAFKTEYGEGYDVVLITNFLHHFDVPTCEQFLKKARKALRPGGVALTLEFVPNDDRVTPPASAAFSMVMLCSTRAGDAYTFSELDSMFRNAGFSRSKLVELPGGMQQAVVSEVSS